MDMVVRGLSRATALPVAVMAFVPVAASAGPFSGGYAGLQGAVFSSAEIDNPSGDLDLQLGASDLGGRFDIVFGGGVQQNALYWSGELAATIGGELEEAVVSDDGVLNEQQLTHELELALSDGYRGAVRFGGVLREGTTLFYAKLAYGVRELEATESMNGLTRSDDDDISGPGYGFGLEYRPGDYPLFLRVEGMRYEYGDANLIDDYEFEVTEHTTDIALGVTF